jgi:Arc/MetJ family transcription regulator
MKRFRITRCPPPPKCRRTSCAIYRSALDIDGQLDEPIQRIAPFRVKYKRLRANSGGPGENRGGLGQEILFENRSESPIAVFFLTEHILLPAAFGQGAA